MSILVKVLSLIEYTKLDKCHGYLAINLRYENSNIVIRAVHICISTALRDVPTKLLI